MWAELRRPVDPETTAEMLMLKRSRLVGLETAAEMPLLKRRCQFARILEPIEVRDQAV
ncbi:hypothetical protein [Paenibacillus jilunlii]|uniref:hypothetical protein n=1 Tax=Paenibacillus jilunlii TaxID=682956 RepID=UPI000AD9EAC7|nr:hypothetical protein [Paenibacillus jilunlii]